MNSGVYEIVNLTNGKRYVGSALNLKGRKRDHWRYLREGNHHNRYLQRSWNKYGADAFVFRVLHILYPESLIVIEQGEIDTKSEYNIRKWADSNTGLRWSAETRAKQSAAQKGKKRSAESVAKTSAANKGQKRTAEQRERISAAVRGKPWSPAQRAANVGRKATAEARANMSAAHMGVPWSPARRECKVTEETRAKMSTSAIERMKDPKERAKAGASNRGNKYFLGHKHTPEAKAKISAALKGKKLTAEHKVKIGAASKGKPWTSAQYVSRAAYIRGQ